MAMRAEDLRPMLNRVVTRAATAPSVHNIQPARWMLRADGLLVLCDTTVSLPASDPSGRDAALSCGAAVEATCLALAAEGCAVTVEDLWQTPPDLGGIPAGLRPVARLVPAGLCDREPEADLLDRRFTHRGRFRPDLRRDFVPEDAVMITDPAQITDLARLHDHATLQVLQDAGQRAELRHWMRLSPRDPRREFDGMSAAALRMGRATAWAAGLVLGPLWPVISGLGLGDLVGSEAGNTRSAAAIALFHRPTGESPVQSGRAYLRLWLAATGRGWAGWPMAALGDDPAINAEISARFDVPAGRKLIQCLRFGPADQSPPPRARRPLSELILG